MALCCIPSAVCTFHKLASSSSAPPFPGAQDSVPAWATFLVRPPHRSLTLSCFAKKPRAARKAKAPKLNMSNDELCRELRTFISEEGLPVNRLPSMAELSRRGRKDLANLVRKRGYKIISLIYESQIDEALDVEKSLAEMRSLAVTTHTEPQSDATIESLGEGYDKTNGHASSDLSSMKNYINGNGAFTSVDKPSELFQRNIQATVSSRQHGELYPARDTSTINNTYTSPKSYETSNLTYADTTEGLFVTQKGSPLKSMPPGSESTRGEDIVLGEEEKITDTGAFTSEVAETDKQREIYRLRAMLYEKEVELQQLKQEIEKEKLALINLQRKTRAEIDNIQSLISAKEEELRAAEEGLFGLKEVQIEYRAHGEAVELTGSFNGWQHRITMDRQSSPDGQTTTDTRNSALWSTTLWLYPGVYEIKFVVDGHWRNCPQRESVTKGHITNNILRVE